MTTIKKINDYVTHITSTDTFANHDCATETRIQAHMELQRHGLARILTISTIENTRMQPNIACIRHQSTCLMNRDYFRKKQESDQKWKLQRKINITIH
jgi:hypothetical protein